MGFREEVGDFLDELAATTTEGFSSETYCVATEEEFLSVLLATDPKFRWDLLEYLAGTLSFEAGYHVELDGDEGQVTTQITRYKTEQQP